MQKLKVLELFAGIGACSKALERLNIPHEIVDAVEIDKYAIKSFNAIHGTNFEPQDITTWDKDIKVDLICHGSPCTNFSLAGKQEGGNKGSGTPSSLMYESIRIIEKLKPKYVLWENVKNLLSKKHRHNFDAYLETMEQLGYKSYYQVLNAKDYGIPQNRERVFTISILGNKNYEFPKGNECNNTIKVVGNYMPSGHDASRIVDEDGLAPTVKENHGTVTAVLQRFEFPEKQELKVKLKDMLEDEVDEKYYLSEDKIHSISHWKAYQKPFEKVQGRNSIVPTLTARGAGEEHSGMITYCSDLEDTTNLQEQCLHIKEATKQGYKDAFEGDGVNISARMQYQRGNVQKESIQTLTTSGGNDRGVVVDKLPGAYGRDFGSKGKIQNKEYCDTLTASMGTGGGNVPIFQDNLRIRKLTPKECWRLMGFDDIDFKKAEKINSSTQLYKQAGNSIVVNVLEAIFKELFSEYIPNLDKWSDLD